MPIASAALAMVPLLLQERTFTRAGAGIHPLWYIPLIVLVASAVMLPATTPRLIIPRPRLVLALLPFLLIGLLLVPAHFAIGLGMCAIAVALAPLPLPAAQRLSAISLAAALGWGAVALVSWAFEYAEPRVAPASITGPPLTLLLHMLGFDVTLPDARGLLSVGMDGIYTPVLPSLDKFGGSFPLALITGLVILGRLAGLSWRWVGAAAMFTLVYALARAAWVVTRGIERANEPLNWWLESQIAGSFAPLILILVCGGLCGARLVISPTKERKTSVLKPVGFIAACCAAGLLVLGWNWSDPGQVKIGNVLVDEHYSRWEWSETPINTEEFGVRTVYNYSDLVDGIGHYVPVARNFDKITDEVLQDVSVLVLKTPTSPYPLDVVDTIDRFVRRGGGLWLIGDHTNVFGMGGYLNLVGEPLVGLSNNFDAVIDPIANRQMMRQTQMAHPITRRMPLFIWMTSNSVRAPWGARDLIRSPRMLSDTPDFSQNTGFGDFRVSLAERVGNTVQGVAIPHGKGRIALWSDSTVFSNFGIYLPGKFELGLGYIDWLRRKNSAFPMRLAMISLGALAALVALIRRAGPLAIAGGWLGAGIGTALVPLHYQFGYPPITPDTPFETIAFYEPEVTTEHLPLTFAVQGEVPACYWTSYIAVQRIGKRPCVISTLDDLNHDALVFIHNGHVVLDDVEIDRVLDFVAQGGHLILIDSGIGDRTLLNRAADAAGIEVRPYRFVAPPKFAQLQQEPGNQAGPTVELPVGPVLRTSNGTLVGTQAVTATLYGPCESLLSIVDNSDPVAARAQLGEGFITIMMTTDAFADTTLGENSTIPSVEQYGLYTVLFETFRIGRGAQ